MRSRGATSLIALALTLATLPAHAGGVLICNGWLCRGSPYFPPPIIVTRPPVVSDHPPMIYQPGPMSVLPPPTPQDLRLPDFPPSAYRRPPPPVRRDPPPRPRKSADEIGIEKDIMAFCDDHPDEAFCGKLGAYLRAHPDRVPK